MAYQRRRTYRKKRTYRKRQARSTFAGTAVRAIKGYGLKLLKSKLGLNTETKYVDGSATTLFTTTLTANQALSNMATLVPQGLTDNTRTGNAFRMTKFSFTGLLVNGAANLVYSTTVRVIFVNWGKTAVSATTAADILEDPTSINSPYTMDPSFPHTILYDKTMCLGRTDDPTLPNLRRFKFTYAPLSHHVRYTTTDTTGALSACIEGYVQAYIIVNSATASNFPFLTGYTRMSFVDN